ncbi:MAG: hypothetical protein ACD_23C00879G0003 [uncultured bacterium]|nr:MAG: hypothetical protein ACD_23C00879G0003 [uncultured bacterium]
MLFKINILQMSGAAGGDRTHDPWLRRPILYPLSYSRILLKNCKTAILAHQKIGLALKVQA